jgi:large subunit ribosomal protein L9
MKVILTEKVKTLGNVGDIVNVAAGFARNYLIPNRFALLADEKNKNVLADANKKLAKKIEGEKKTATDLQKKIEGLTLTFVKRVGASGKIFGSITNTELASELAKNHGVEIERRMIVIETPIKSVGTFNVKAKLFHGVEAKFKVKVELDAAQVEEMKKAQEAAAKKKAAKAQEAAEAPAADATTTEA